MNRRFATLIAVPAAGAALLLAGSGVASADPVPASATSDSVTSAPASAAYTEGAVNIDLTVSNNTDQPMTLLWSGLRGSADHWNKRPLATLPAHASEELTGYSHNIVTELDMSVAYRTAAGDSASFDVQANSYATQGVDNSTTGTGVVWGDEPATDLTTTATVTEPTSSLWDYAVATMSIDPAV